MSRLKGNRLWWLSLGIWIALAVVLSALAPAANEYVESNKDAGLPEDVESIIADRELEKHFPQDGGLPIFAVFHKEEGITNEEIQTFAEALGNLETEATFDNVETLPLSNLDVEIQRTFLSENEKTFFVPLTLENGLEGNDLNDLVVEMKDVVGKDIDDSIEVSWTGPGAIASDAVELFSRADLVLLLSTVGLLLVLLLVIYRSPLLTLIPLVGAGITYSVVDRLIGLSASAGLFTTESQALSIMLILLFAVVTDYSLLIFSRYREELRIHESADAAMRETMRHVKEPIFFSGSTIVLGVATLFFTLYEPYRNFAPVFVIAAAVMLIAGLTLLPALFALIGRKAFWPIIPKFGEKVVEKKTIWGTVANKVTKRPVLFLIPITLLLLLGSWNVKNLEESYDLIDSFPEDLSSRVGYERLATSFSPGGLAPGSLLFVSENELGMEELQKAVEEIEGNPGVESVTVQGNPLTEDKKSAKFTLTLAGNPYSVEAFEVVEELRNDGQDIMTAAGVTDTKMHIAGESARYLDITEVNTRDTWQVMITMTILISIMLGLQTRSIIAPIYMMGSILLSYAATLGLSLYLFEQFLGLDAINYRIPLYTFVFLVALGVDYSIMLIARIREEMVSMPFEDAVRKGLERTGGVISSAGIILAATFLVLTTMPISELKLFGFVMALGILIDTFVVRPLVIPAILILLGKWSFWPKKINK